jgi:serine/threonine protein kinase
MAFPVESIIRGRYLIQSQLGTGNVGDVYLVRDQLITWKSPILFAFKEVINPNRHQLYQITLDGMALRLLQHQALPRVYNVLSDAKHDRVYVQMEYIEGSNLDKLRLRRTESRFSFTETMTIMTPIMDAVAYLHSQRSPIIHQDIKPANIIVSFKQGMVMLVNFGVGKQYKLGLTARHSLTPYEAPEQYHGEINTLTDIYGLGATLYTLLTGIAPLDALYRASKSVDPLIPVNQMVPTVSPLVADAIHHAMSLNSGDRIPSVQQFKQALKANPRLQASSTLNLRLILQELDLSLKADAVLTQPSEPSIATQSQTTLVQNKPPEAIIVPPVPTIQPAPIIPEKAEEIPAAPIIKQPRFVRSRKLGILLPISVVLLIGLSIGTVYLLSMTYRGSHSATPAATSLHKNTPQTTPAPSSTTSANLAGLYNGTISSLATSLTTKMSLTEIQQNLGNISGDFIGLNVSGPLRGLVDVSRRIHFTVMNVAGHPVFFFDGAIQSDGNVAGSYCTLDQKRQCSGDYGVWSVTPASPGQFF